MRIACALALLVGAWLVPACGGDGDQPTVSFHTAEPTSSPSDASPTPLSGPRWPVTIAAVGDIMLARSVADAITTQDPAGPFAGVRELLAGADFTVGNLECVLGEGGRPEPKGYTFRGPPLGARGLNAAGFDVLAVANNHSLDYGRDAFLESLALLAANGIATAGGGRHQAEALAPAIVQRAGLRVAFLSFAEVPDEGAYSMRAWQAGPTTPGIAWVDETIPDSIAAARAQADLVVVMLHFGVEGSPSPSNRQREVARGAIDAGAAIVLGSHPHVLQQVEEYRGGIIAYSLGNFVFDGFEGAANQTAVLLITIHEDGRLRWRLEPVSIGFDGLPRPR